MDTDECTDTLPGSLATHPHVNTYISKYLLCVMSHFRLSIGIYTYGYVCIYVRMHACMCVAYGSLEGTLVSCFVFVFFKDRVSLALDVLELTM